MLGRRMAVLGADNFTPQQLAGSPEMTSAQLADLDRRLSPAEQKRVDDFQVSEGDATLKKERATPYVDPKTGEKRTAEVTWEEAPPPVKSKESEKSYAADLPPPVKSRTAWYVVGACAALAVLVGLLARRS